MNRLKFWNVRAGYLGLYACLLSGVLAGLASADTSTSENALNHRKVKIVVLADPGEEITLEQQRHAFPFGTAISRNAFNGKMSPLDRNVYLKTLQDNFNFAVHENAMKWVQMQPEEDALSFEMPDRMLQWCQAHDIGMRGHTILWAKMWRTPKWIRELEAEALREVTRARVQRVVSHYRGRITDFDLNNEMLDASFFRDKLGEAAAADLFRWAASANPTARLFLNENNILNGQRVEAYVKLIEQLLEQGAPIGGIGVQGHFEQLPDEATLRQALDRLGAFGLPIWITEYDIKTADESIKAQALERVYRVAFEHPAVEGIMMWGFWAGQHWLAGPDAVPGYTALWDQQWVATPSAATYRRLVFGEWWSRDRQVADENGRAVFDVFAGRHRLSRGTTSVDVDVATPGETREVDLRSR